MTEILILLAVIAALVVVQILRATLAGSTPSRVEQRRIDPPAPPAPFAPLFAARARELEALGFVPWFWASVRAEPAHLPLVRLVQYWRHAELPVVAQVRCPAYVHESGECPVHFLSPFADGRLLGTSRQVVDILPTIPELGVTVTGDYPDPAAQFAAHRESLGTARDALRDWQSPEDVLATMNRYEAEHFAHRVARGHLVPTPDGAYRLGLALAVRATLQALRGRLVRPPPSAALPVPPERAAALFRGWRNATLVAPPRTVQLALFTVSTLAFAVLGALFWDLTFALLLLAVIAFHELGHYLAMRALGYRNTQMLMLPLVGGVAMGHEERPDGAHRAIVSLMGPLPGILLGWALLLLAPVAELPQPAMSLALILLAVNYLNLLPFPPLDGGNLIKSLLPRQVWALMLFELAGVAGLLGIAWGLGAPLFAVLAIAPALSALGLVKRHRALRALDATPTTPELETIRCAFAAADRFLGGPQPLAKSAPVVQSLLTDARLVPAPLWARTVLLALFLGCFVAPLAAFPMLRHVVSQPFAFLDAPRVPTVDAEPFRAEARALELLPLADGVAATMRAMNGVSADAGRARDTAPPTSPAASPALDGHAASPPERDDIVAAEARLGVALTGSLRTFYTERDGLTLWDETRLLRPLAQVQRLREAVDNPLTPMRAAAAGFDVDMPAIRRGLFVVAGGQGIDFSDPDAPVLPWEAMPGLILLGSDERVGLVLAEPAAVGGEHPVWVIHPDEGVIANRHDSLRAWLESLYADTRTALAYREAWSASEADAAD